MTRGGKRIGAGRKPTLEGARPQNQLRAFPDEWQVIKAFAEIVKHGNRQAAIDFVKQYSVIGFSDF